MAIFSYGRLTFCPQAKSCGRSEQPFRARRMSHWYKSQGFKEIKEWTLISADLREVIKKL